MAEKTKKELTMHDCVGNTVKVGDAVVYIEKTYCTARLSRGTVSSIKKAFGKERATVNGGWNSVESQSIYKL